MGKTTVKINFDSIKNELLNPRVLTNDNFKKKLGNFVDRETKKRVEVGISPVLGVGRFMAYAFQRLGRGYPKSVRKNFPNKKDRPVNLKLTGEFLNAIGFKLTNTGIEYGLMSKEKLDLEKFENHNNGADPRVPQRKFVPVDEGDRYAASIENGILNIYFKRISEVIKKINR